MADNIPPHLVRKQLNARLHIPTETWTAIFEMLPRSTLVQITPVNHLFKEICDKIVKTRRAHPIWLPCMFLYRLHKREPEAMQQLAHLKANSCSLSGLFKFVGKICIKQENMDILRHCLDLFQGCKVSFYCFQEDYKRKADYCKECLNLLERKKPVEIYIKFGPGSQQIKRFLPHPIIQNCSRLVLKAWSGMTTFKAIYDWLHRKPMPQGDDNANGNGVAGVQQVRGLIYIHIDMNMGQAIVWFLNRCIQDLQESTAPAHRLQFVFSFMCWPGILGFEQPFENHLTGEALVLDQLMDRDRRPSDKYRLRRCLAEEVAERTEFYARTFKRGWGLDAFNNSIGGDGEAAVPSEVVIL